MKSLLGWVMVLALLLVVGVRPAAAQGRLVAAVTAAPRVARAGRPVVATVTISSAEHAVGSYTAELRWDPWVLQYEGMEGPGGQWMAVVGERWAEAGRLTFAGANIAGFSGSLAVARVKFTARSAGLSHLRLRVAAMAEAVTFADLLAGLKVRSTQVLVWR